MLPKTCPTSSPPQKENADEMSDSVSCLGKSAMMHHNTEKKSKSSVSFTWRAESSSQKKSAPSASKKK